MPFKKTNIEGLLIYDPKVFEDKRGYFFESYNSKIFKEAGIENQFVQDNQSLSQKGVLRGLHYQIGEFAQAKLVRVLEGSVLDVAVDIRKESSTFGEHFKIELSAENKLNMFVPRGFAHGFLVLSDHAVFAYKCDNYYSKEHEAGIIYNDPTISIDWQSDTHDLNLSEKDRQLPLLESADINFVEI